MSVRVAVADAAATTALRRAVLRPGWAVGTAMPGDDLPGSLHIAAFDEDSTVGACMLVAAPYPHRELPEPWQLRGMATAEGRRGAGIGTLVLDAAYDAVRERGGRAIWCKARVTALRFYERNGFTADTDVYVEPNTGLPHRDMYRLT